MAKQMIRFNYFKPRLANEAEEYDLWNMKPFIEYILSNKNSFTAAVVLGDEISDLEWNSCGYDDKNELYYIQLSKLRSKNIPSRKRINKDKVSIDLEKDEFLGEFNLLIFDPKYNILITQGNFYGLTSKQIALSLSNLRLKYKESIGQSEGDSPSVVHLEPLIDKDAISDVKQNKIYRKITIKGADYHELANEDLTSDMLSTSIKALDEVNGVNFEISVTMAREARNKSLDQSEVRKIIDDVLILKEKDLDVSMNIATKKDENNAIEYIDLLTPRLTSSIVVEVENRSTIGAEYIFESFKDQNYYNEEVHMQSILRSILYQN
ncbi:DUF6731 family protein [Enterococcus casseliflavus]|uniref:DUF6731 family protein n=1 Tax=Enterococcus casseliflavus TaxID=37734 RepID=UPI0037CBBBEF